MQFTNNVAILLGLVLIYTMSITALVTNKTSRAMLRPGFWTIVLTIVVWVSLVSAPESFEHYADLSGMAYTAAFATLFFINACGWSIVLKVTPFKWLGILGFQIVVVIVFLITIRVGVGQFLSMNPRVVEVFYVVLLTYGIYHMLDRIRLRHERLY